MSNSQGDTYYMTLNPDGSGTTTYDGGESGMWQFKEDHIETFWNPKVIKLYFNSGKTTPLAKPSVNEAKAGTSSGVRIDKIP